MTDDNAPWFSPTPEGQMKQDDTRALMEYDRQREEDLRSALKIHEQQHSVTAHASSAMDVLATVVQGLERCGQAALGVRYAEAFHTASRATDRAQALIEQQGPDHETALSERKSAIENFERVAAEVDAVLGSAIQGTQKGDAE